MWRIHLSSKLAIKAYLDSPLHPNSNGSFLSMEHSDCLVKQIRPQGRYYFRKPLHSRRPGMPQGHPVWVYFAIWLPWCGAYCSSVWIECLSIEILLRFLMETHSGIHFVGRYIKVKTYCIHVLESNVENVKEILNWFGKFSIRLMNAMPTESRVSS